MARARRGRTGFEVGFVHREDGKVRISLSDAVAVRFEHVPPVR